MKNNFNRAHFQRRLKIVAALEEKLKTSIENDTQRSKALEAMTLSGTGALGVCVAVSETNSLKDNYSKAVDELVESVNDYNVALNVTVSKTQYKGGYVPNKGAFPARYSISIRHAKPVKGDGESINQLFRIYQAMAEKGGVEKLKTSQSFFRKINCELVTDRSKQGHELMEGRKVSELDIELPHRYFLCDYVFLLASDNKSILSSPNPFNEKLQGGSGNKSWVAQYDETVSVDEMSPIKQYFNEIEQKFNNLTVKFKIDV